MARGPKMTTMQAKTFRPRAEPVKPPPGARSLGIAAFDAMALVRHVRRGFAFRRLAKLQKAMGLPWDKMARLISIPQRTLARRQRAGRLGPDESDRVLRVATVFDLAVDLFEGDVAGARRWLQAPQFGFGGEVPLELASTEVGAKQVVTLITQLEYGVFP
jgi:putative toxin-antitoxin system antitoxin component (TIGR02293 family)